MKTCYFLNTTSKFNNTKIKRKFVAIYKLTNFQQKRRKSEKLIVIYKLLVKAQKQHFTKLLF